MVHFDLTTKRSSASRKGKQRARDEGEGAAAGIVISLGMVGTGVYDVAYTVPISVGDDNSQKFSLQVDTGSSDLWIASKSCSTSPCSQLKGSAYDPSNAQQTGQSFSIPYLQGNVSGPIVWDQVQVGGYSLENQAFAAADNVQDEALTPDFSGILGLALPMNSIIAAKIPPVTSNSPDGATFTSNLFGITPISTAPSFRFLSVALSRPGSNRVESTLGIGRHPSKLVPDPSKVQYSPLVSDPAGTLFWKSNVRALSVWVNGEERQIELGKSNGGGAFPEAVLDSGVPLILTTSTLANGIYGAIGVGPASDGKYYVPCTTPLNITVTLDNRPPIPLHPLDLTAQPPQDPSSKNCIGLIQAADSQLATPNSPIGDVVLGVPFLRNTYTVLAFDPPDDSGNFPSPTNRSTSEGVSLTPDVRPRLGLLSLTDPTTAMDEFHKVRVLNQPLGPDPPHGNAGSGGEKKLSVGIDVLIGLLSFFAFCFLLFALRWFLGKHGWIGPGKSGHADTLRNVGGDGGGGRGGERKRRGFFGMAGYKLARTQSQDETTGVTLSEDEMRAKKFDEYVMKERERSENTTMSSGMTKVVEEGLGDGEQGMKHQRNQSLLSATPSSVKRKTSSVNELPAGAAAPAAPGLLSLGLGMQVEPWDPQSGGSPAGVGGGVGVGVGGGGDQRLSRQWPTITDQPYDTSAGQDQRSHRQRNLSNEQPLEPFEEFSAVGAVQSPAPPPPPPKQSFRPRSVSNEPPMQPYKESSAIGAVQFPPAQPPPPQTKRSHRQRNVSNEQPMQPYEEFSGIGASTSPSSTSTKKQLPMHLKHLSTDQPLQAYQDFSAGGGGGGEDSSQEMDLDLVTARITPTPNPNIPYDPYRNSHYSSRSPEPGTVHQRTGSQLSNRVNSPMLHGPHNRSESQQSYIPAYPPSPFGRPVDERRLSALEIPPQEQQMNEFGMLVDVDATSSVEEGGGTMVGVGTAMRGSRIDPKWRNLSIGRDATGSPTFVPVESPVTVTDSPTTFLPSSVAPMVSRKRHHGRSSLSGGGSRGGGAGSGSISSFERTGV